MTATVPFWGGYWTAPILPAADSTSAIYRIDWERRRLIPARCGPEKPARCVHGDFLTVWCHDCEGDLDAIAADFT